jgi:hypothetical protein
MKQCPIPDTIPHVRPDGNTDDDGDRADLASDAFRIGIGTDGQDHIFSRIRATVTVLDEGEHVRSILRGTHEAQRRPARRSLLAQLSSQIACPLVITHQTIVYLSSTAVGDRYAVSQ